MNDLHFVRAAYLYLLRLSHGKTRNHLQGAMAMIRDEIAYLEEREPQEVQDEFEGKVAAAIVVRAADRG